MHQDTIYKTYRTNFSQLSPSKRFHFATRLHLLKSDPWSAEQLLDLKSWFFGGDIKQKLDKLGQSQPDPLHLNASEERMPIFDAHPWLFGYELQLFQVLHAKTQYQIDLRPLLHDPVDDLETVVQELIADPGSLAVLSTYLIDIYYLYYRILHEQETPLIDQAALQHALSFDFSPQQKSRLNIYLLTHCIIGETHFYARPIPEHKKEYYASLARKLETIAHDSWKELTLDNKLEIALGFLLTGFDSPLIKNAAKESELNFDTTLGFITDPAMPHKNTLEWAEHRNVLYLMVVDYIR